MKQIDLKVAAEKAIQMALDCGAEMCDVIGARGSSFSLTAQEEKIDKYKVSSSQAMGIRVIKDQKVGLSYTESLDDEALSTMSKQAVEVSNYGGEDEFQRIDDAKETIIETHPNLYQQDETDIQDKIKMTLELEAAVKRGGDKVKNSPYNGYGDGESEQVYVNHLGAYCYHRERSFSCYTSALTEFKGRQAMYGHSMVGRTFKELDPQICGDNALKYAIALLDGTAIATGKYDVIFAPDELDQLLGCFFSCFSGRAAMEDKSKFKDRLGDSVADPRLSLFDRPQYKEGFYYSSFDDEGMPRQDLSLIEGGILKNFYHNTCTARYFKCKTTGHGARSPKGGLGVSGTQIVIGKGDTSDTDIEAGRFLKVIGLKGLHSGTNAISGQFSLAVDGILMADGKVEQFVRDVTISGNFFSLLKQIEGIGTAVLANSSRSFFAPSIRFGGLSVAGAS